MFNLKPLFEFIVKNTNPTCTLRDKIEAAYESHEEEKNNDFTEKKRRDLKKMLIEGMYDDDLNKTIRISNLKDILNCFYSNLYGPILKKLGITGHISVAQTNLLLYVPSSFVTEITDNLITLKISSKDLEKVFSINYKGTISTKTYLDEEGFSVSKFRQGYLVLTKPEVLTDLVSLYKNCTGKSKIIEYKIKMQPPNIYHKNTNLILTVPLNPDDNANVTIKERHNEFNNFNSDFDTKFIYK
jgi:hypothetical protein